MVEGSIEAMSWTCLGVDGADFNVDCGILNFDWRRRMACFGGLHKNGCAKTTQPSICMKLYQNEFSLKFQHSKSNILLCSTVLSKIQNYKVLFFGGEVDSVVVFLAGGVDARQEHHLVVVAVLHDVVVDILHIIS